MEQRERTPTILATRPIRAEVRAAIVPEEEAVMMMRRWGRGW